MHFKPKLNKVQFTTFSGFQAKKFRNLKTAILSGAEVLTLKKKQRIVRIPVQH